MNTRSIPSIDWDSLGFDVVETRSMYYTTCKINEKWSGGGLIPYGTIELSPAAGVLNYGQGVFEGTKAFRTGRNRVILFRPEMNARRMGLSTRRLCIPEVEEDFFYTLLRKQFKIIWIIYRLKGRAACISAPLFGARGRHWVSNQQMNIRLWFLYLLWGPILKAA